MALTAREWLLLPKDEQQRRGKELSPEECRKLRMELSEIYFTEEEKKQISEEERMRFIHPRKKTKEEIEARYRASFKTLQTHNMLPSEATYEEWVRRGKPLNW